LPYLSILIGANLALLRELFGISLISNVFLQQRQSAMLYFLYILTRALSKALMRSTLLSSGTSLAFLKTTCAIMNVYGFFMATRKL
jgi:hypothetical protein